MPVAKTHLRRQVAIGKFIADFCCLKAKLIVEVDGNQHGFDDNIVREEKRMRYLRSQDFTALRFFSKREVLTAIDGVFEAIYAHLCCTTPTPNPSPQGGGEQAGV